MMFSSRILMKNVYSWATMVPCAKHHFADRHRTLFVNIFNFLKYQSFHSLSQFTSVCGQNLTNSCIPKPGLSIISMTVRLKHENPYPDLIEDDLEEMFVRGHGPGGQSVNKTTNCVLLKHKPTGVQVKCHETRSLDTNRKRARIRLQEKLDWHFNKEGSVKEIEKRQSSKRRQDKKKKTNLKLERLRAFKEELKKDEV